MASRLKLHEELIEVLGENRCFFQPPESVKLVYPCIVYNVSSGETTFADDVPYSFKKRYTVTIIGRDPDTALVERMAMRFPSCIYERRYVADNLYHDVFALYY